MPLRTCILLPLLAAACLSTCGCLPHGDAGHVISVWGESGEGRGQFKKPRAVTIDAEDHLYIVDMTARIQVFDREGHFIRSWSTPQSVNGRPTGISFDREGNLMVADTHYFQVLFYRPDGRQLDRKIGGTWGIEPGQFNFVTDAVQDSKGNYYVSEYGPNDRIQKFKQDGTYVLQFGSHGDQPGQFNRPNKMVIDDQDQLWVADACNHRIQVFDAREEPPRLTRCWGEFGTKPGQLRYPYDLLLSGQYLYICEFGNHRVQKFTRDGQFVASFGGPGREPGQFAQPWGMVQDSRGELHVLDSYNHRVQRIRF